jgi:hypothetical protein
MPCIMPVPGWPPICAPGCCPPGIGWPCCILGWPGGMATWAGNCWAIIIAVVDRRAPSALQITKLVFQKCCVPSKSSYNFRAAVPAHVPVAQLERHPQPAQIPVRLPFVGHAMVERSHPKSEMRSKKAGGGRVSCRAKVCQPR